MAGVIAVILFVCCLWHWKQTRAAKHVTVALSPATLRLPFTLPCAVDAGDANPLYAAVRGRDRTLLLDMVAQRRVMMVKQGTPVDLLPASQIVIVSLSRGGHGGLSCYIPSDIVPVIEHQIPR
ncbi:hypothetical protein [Silvibacterium bohemicum]|nr:hypothetical protein [Silvibacterium bohemicum]